MNSETKNCQNCKNDFIIESEDFNFYEKIKVPPPTFCPECRMIRRMIWRNCRSLFKRECGNCNKSVISMYSPLRTGIVYCTDCWNSDERNPFNDGFDYDFSNNFFIQLKKLREKSPVLFAHHTGTLIRSEFTNYSLDNKDCYLSYSVINCENVLYSEVVDNCKNTQDCYAVQKVDGCSYNIDCEANYNTHHAVKSRNCIDSYFIYDCVNCQNCCLSSNLRNQKYVFKNKKLSKEEYEKEIENLKLNTYTGIENTQKEFDNIFTNKSIHRFAQIYNSQNAKGDYIGNSKNIYNSFDVQNSENIYYTVRAIANSKDCYDNQGIAVGELIYESIATSFGSYKDSFTYICVGSKECEYSFMCKSCSHCFGCFGLKNNQYCIFNKQYKKDEYFILVDKIKKHMDEMPYIDDKGRIYKYGELFPFDMSPFGYNETNAHDNLPIKKEFAIEKGYPWMEREEKNYNISIKSFSLPDSIKDCDDSVLNEIIACPNNGNQDFQCTTAYRLTQAELNFCRQKNLPLPRYCPNCRHYKRLTYRNHIKLWRRSCMKEGCKNEFDTTYSPDEPYKVYCEKCYQDEVC
jgi:hypothetical protein